MGSVQYHLPAALKGAYGDTAGYAMDTTLGLLQYVVAFVNRPATPVGQLPSTRPVGREKLRALLHAAVHGTEPNLAAPSEAFRADLDKWASAIKWEPRLEGAGWRHHAFILDATGFYALVASLLLDADTRSQISECRHCGDLFVIQPRAKHDGRMNRLYCSQEHMRAANDAANTVRQRQRRTRLRAQKILVEKGWTRAAAEGAILRAFEKAPEATAEQLAGHARAPVSGARKHK